MKYIILSILLCCAAFGYAEKPRSVLLVAGKPSHGEGEHEFHAGCDVLARALDGSGMAIKASVQYDTWPSDEQLIGIDALVVYCDGDGKHVALDHEAALAGLAEQGVGIVFLHYAVDGEPGALNGTLLKVIGGYYNEGQSKNPEWRMKDPQIAEHPVTRGVEPFELKDEWYYNLNFGDVVPLLTAVPPEEDQAHVLAWAYGTNAFGFTGGHFHRNWARPDFRKLILNAIVWSAGLDVPENGVLSDDPLIAQHDSILHAIAKGDAGDVHVHLKLGTDVDGANKRGWTPLHFCAVRGKAGCAKVLIENGATLDPRTGTKKTPLHFVADRGFMELVKLLVEAGADTAARDDEGWTPLHYAAEKDRVGVAAYLIKQGAEVDALSKRGGTPLHEASASASPEMIKLLLDNGADKSIKATNGKTPLDYAIDLGNDPAAAILE